ELRQLVADKEAKIDKKSEQLEQKSAELMKLSVEYKGLQASIEQKLETYQQQELELKTAQQHLAKKIKELAELKSVTEQQKADLNNQRNRIDTLEMRIEDLKDEAARKESGFSARESELLSTKQHLERAIAAKDEELSRSKIALETYKEQVADLKAVEAQYIKLKEKFSELGLIFGSQQTPKQPVPLPPPPPKPQEEIQEKPSQSEELFSVQNTPARFRNSFFDD
ncbi:MAG: hypothetical protein KDK48_04770, partial [Chlamydiia bacterium]|nr:hypothetical protein [Chlamydiia bacterium]